MTAPIAPTPAAPAAPVTPPAPAAVPDAPVGRTWNDAIAHVAAKTSIAPDAAPAEVPSVKIVPNAPNKPDILASADAPAGSAPVAAAPDTLAPNAADAPPVEAAPDAPAPELSGELTVDDGDVVLRAERNADGTYKTKLDPTQKLELVFKDKETGEQKVYNKTLPEVLRLARDGVALQPIVQKLKPEVDYYRTNIPQWQERFTSLESQLTEQMALNRELLSAPDDIVIARREEFAKEMSPEKRLARIEAERHDERARAESTRARETVTRQANAFLETRIAPVIREAEGQLGVEAVAGKIALATQPLMENGLIPPKHWAQVEAYVQGPFREWVKAETAKKGQADAATKKARELAEAEQRRAQAAVNDAGRTLVPAGRAAPDAPPSSPKPKNTQEAISRMINRPLPATVGAPAG